MVLILYNAIVCYFIIALQITLRLQRITSEPTQINMVFKLSFPDSLAAIGAAIKPPNIKPAITLKCASPNTKTNVAVLHIEVKNLVNVEVPMVYFGSRPPEIRVLVTNGPQPPPKASKKPPDNATGVTFVSFFLSLLLF